MTVSLKAETNEPSPYNNYLQSYLGQIVTSLMRFYGRCPYSLLLQQRFRNTLHFSSQMTCMGNGDGKRIICRVVGIEYFCICFAEQVGLQIHRLCKAYTRTYLQRVRCSTSIVTDRCQRRFNAL